MCGRYSLFVPPEDLSARLDADVEGYEPRYNAAPGQSLPVVADDRPTTLSWMDWGLVPPWADEADGHINARAETLRERPSFSDAFEGIDSGTDGEFATGRCLVPADGFYEWVETDGESRPYRVRRPGDRPFAMAGLWTQFRPASEQTGLDAFAGGGDTGEPEIRETFAIVTTEPNETVAELHHRMAVILPEERQRRWLSGSPDELEELLCPYEGDLEAYPVSRAVNDPANDSPDIVEPLEG
jgi:putative SOS response-associated peptidase YedK